MLLELGSRQTPLKTAAVMPAGQRGGSPSGRNQSLLSDVGDPGWVGASDRLGSAVTASTSWSLIGSRSTRSSCRCPASVSVTISVTRYRRSRTCPGCRRRLLERPCPGPGVSYSNGRLTPSPTPNPSLVAGWADPTASVACSSSSLLRRSAGPPVGAGGRLVGGRWRGLLVLVCGAARLTGRRLVVGGHGVVVQPVVAVELGLLGLRQLPIGLDV